MIEAGSPQLPNLNKIINRVAKAVKTADQDVRNADLLGFKNAGLNVNQIAEKFKPKKPETTTGYEVDRMIISLGELDVQKSRASDPADVRRRTEAYDRLMEKIFNSMGGTISRSAIQEEAILDQMQIVAEATVDAAPFNSSNDQENDREREVLDRILLRKQTLQQNRLFLTKEKGKTPIIDIMRENEDFQNYSKTGKLPAPAPGLSRYRHGIRGG